jgi:hypothetical protein
VAERRAQALMNIRADIEKTIPELESELSGHKFVRAGATVTGVATSILAPLSVLVASPATPLLFAIHVLSVKSIATAKEKAQALRDAIGNLKGDLRLTDAVLGRNGGLIGRIQQALDQNEAFVRDNCRPKLTLVTGVFTPAAFSTLYTEAPQPTAINQNLHYKWTVSIPVDPDCALGFQPNTPNPNQATWYHADVSQGGHCNHSGTDYDAAGRGHPGIVTVVVFNQFFTCTETYHGTQGDGVLSGVGDPLGPCKENPD